MFALQIRLLHFQDRFNEFARKVRIWRQLFRTANENIASLPGRTVEYCKLSSRKTALAPLSKRSISMLDHTEWEQRASPLNDPLTSRLHDCQSTPRETPTPKISGHPYHQTIVVASRTALLTPFTAIF